MIQWRNMTNKKMLLTRVLTLLKPVVKRTSYLYDTCVSIYCLQ